jgi:hypothetical protein
MSDGFRVRILCEDRRTERFLRGLCKRYGVEVVDVDIAPEGCASAYVFKRYPAFAKQRRSKSFQRNLGLLVHVDGDDRGTARRKAELEASLRAASVDPRGEEEPVAVFVPTWCIETWLLHLAELSRPPETVQLKRCQDPAYLAALRRLGADERGAIRAAVAVWPSSDTPSLQDAQSEAPRVRLR